MRCVAVVRGDHVGRLAEHAAFTERLGAAIVLVPPLTEPELREVVREPAAAVGLTADAELRRRRRRRRPAGRPGALPLLSTALVGTWERRRGDRLTLAGYLEAGGVAGALTRSAEAAYAVLDDGGREQAHHLLVRLADTDDGGALVRRPVPLAELDLDGDRGGAPGGRRGLRGRRLLAVDGERLDVAHEALLTGWPRLARWLEDDAAGRAVRRHLAPAAREWAAPRPAGRRALPRSPARRRAGLGGGADADLTAGRARVPRRLRAHADASCWPPRSGPTGGARPAPDAAAGAGLAAVLVVALVAAGWRCAPSARPTAPAAAERTSLSPTRTGWRRCRRPPGRWTCVPARRRGGAPGDTPRRATRC